MKTLQELTRKNIWDLAPYSCARNEFSGRNASVYLDATVGIPDASSSYVIETRIQRDGKTSMRVK